MDRANIKISMLSSVIIMLIILFVSGGTDDQAGYVLYYLNLGATGKYILLLAILLLLLLQVKRFFLVRGVGVCLCCFSIRVFVELLHLGSEYLDNEVKLLFALLAGIIVLLVYSQSMDIETKSNLEKIVLLYLIIIVLQIVLTFIIVFQRYGSYWGLKNRLHIAVGSSNNIECWIIMLTSFLFYTNKGTKIAWPIFLMGFLGALCTRSKVVVLTWGIWFVIILLGSSKKNMKGVLSIAIVLAVLYSGYSMLNRLSFFEYSQNTLLALLSGDKSSLEAAFNGRLSLYSSGMEIFRRDFFTVLIGAGASYVHEAGIAHNYFVDLLAKSGLVGLISTITLFIELFRLLIKNRYNKYAKPAIIMMIFVIINSMYEPCLDGFMFSIVFFMLVAMGIQKQEINQIAEKESN